MKKLSNCIMVSLFALGTFLPSYVFASSVNGPLTFSSATVSDSPAVAGEDRVTIRGSGFNHIDSVILVQQNGTANNSFNLSSYTLTDTKLLFTIPDETQAGSYDVQVNTDDNVGRTVLINDLPWTFAVEASADNNFELVEPSGGEQYDIGDDIKFEWDSDLSSYSYIRVYLTLFKLKGSSWISSSSDPYQYLDGANYYLSVLSGKTSDEGEYTWEVPTGITGGKYVAYFSIQYGMQSNGSNLSSLSDWSDNSFTLGTSTPSNPPVTPTNSTEAYSEGPAHEVGTNVKTKSGVVYRIVQGPNRSAYTSGNIFLSYKFNNWSEVVQATTGDLALSVTTPMPPRDGALINDNGTVYVISEGKARQPFGSESVFKNYGYSFKYVYPVVTGYLETYPVITSSNSIHPDGTLINDKGTLYIMNSHNRLGVPSVAVLESWGYWLEDAVQANSYDLATPVSAVLSLRPYSQYRY